MALGETHRRYRDQETIGVFETRSAAAATSLSVRSLDYLIEKGQLRAVKVGRRVLIPSRELERLIEQGTSRVFAETRGDGEPHTSAVTADHES